MTHNTEGDARPRRVIPSTPEQQGRVEEALTEMQVSAEYVAAWTASDEWYPYLFLVPESDRCAEAKILLTQEELEFVRFADRTFRQAQDLLEQAEKRAKDAAQYDGKGEAV